MSPQTTSIFPVCAHPTSDYKSPLKRQHRNSLNNKLIKHKQCTSWNVMLLISEFAMLIEVLCCLFFWIAMYKSIGHCSQMIVNITLAIWLMILEHNSVVWVDLGTDLTSWFIIFFTFPVGKLKMLGSTGGGETLLWNVMSFVMNTIKTKWTFFRHIQDKVHFCT